MTIVKNEKSVMKIFTSDTQSKTIDYHLVQRVGVF